MKYSINGTSNIVAERDIYSLGGFIPKGTVGGKIASEAQLSQDGECWLAGGDISGRPDVRVKDNAYIGTFTSGVNPVHTDGVTEFSGNTLIPGNISVRSFVADTKNNVFIKDSFIGVSMDVLCGPVATATAFPFEQGGFNKGVPAGTLFTSASMHTGDANICRTTANLCLGKDTYLYIPTGYSCRVLWGYWNTAGQLAYSGDSFAVSQALTKLEHPTYKMAMIHITRVNGTAMTPDDLLATGAKILGHINSSLLQDFRPESASGQYVMVNSSFLTNTDNFGLNTIQLRYLAGSMYDTNMYTQGISTNYRIYGTFHNVQRLEYTKELPGSHRTAATRDTYISAYDCPLLRVDDDTYDTSLMGTGDLVLRRSIVPKGRFAADPINGNTYEDIDFSYANEDLGFSLPGYAVFNSSHRKGMYRVKAGIDITRGLVSYKGNLADSARLTQAEEYMPLDGSIVEQGYFVGSAGVYYEDMKANTPDVVRTARPVSTIGLTIPTLPAGYLVRSIYYFTEDFKLISRVSAPTSVDTTKPYAMLDFRRDGGGTLNASDFIALNRTLPMTDHTKFPEITGSAYVGAGCTVRGDVQLHGDPYVNRVFDVNMWERGTASQSVGKSWEDSKVSTTLGNRFRLMDTFPVEPGGLITCNSGYWVECGFFDSNGIFISSPGWGSTSNYVPAGAAYAGIVIKKATSASETGGLIEDSDIPLANVMYLRAFKKRRYIVNELDRKSSEDILLGPDMWEQGYLQGGDTYAGKTYEELKSSSLNSIRIKRPVNASTSPASSFTSGFLRNIRSLDALTKLISGEALATYKEALSGIRVQKDPAGAISPSEVPNSRLVLEFVPSPRIIVPYGSNTLTVNGMRIRMYDNAVLSRKFNQEGEIVLQGDAVMGYDFNSGSCMCSNGHSDAIIKLP